MLFSPNMLVFLIVLFPTVDADCPVNIPCFCYKKDLICKYFGNVSQMPPFRSSSTTFDILEINYAPSLTTLQNNAFKGLKVKTIALSHLGLTTIETEAFSSFDDILETLEIIHTQLESVTDDVFNPLKKSLKILKLDHNRLTTLSPTLFSQLTQLTNLSLSYNQLKTVSDDAFSNLLKLKILSLHHNRMTTLSSDLFSNLTHLTNVKISYNPFVCDCHLDWLRNSRLHRQRIIMDNPICSSPPNMNGVSVLRYSTSLCYHTSSTMITTLPTEASTTTTSAATITTTRVCVYGVSYGPDCKMLCKNRHCANSSLSCDVETGACNYNGCQPGWQRDDCTQVCDQGINYGPDCKMLCNSRHCANSSSTCDVHIGTCDSEGCQPGWHRDDCTEALTQGRQGTTKKVVMQIVSGLLFVVVLVVVIISIRCLLISRRRRNRDHGNQACTIPVQ